MAEALEAVHEALREAMLRAGDGMQVATDEAGNLVLKTQWTEAKTKQPAWFGAVQLKKNYVSYHLMPLYCVPALRERLTPDLEKRMQGKSCFNFKKLEPELFATLERLTADCAAAYLEPIEAAPH